MFVASKELEVVLDRILGNDEVRDANAADSIPEASDLHLHQIIPIRGNRTPLDLFQQRDKAALFAQVKRGDEFGQNQIIRDGEILLNQKIEGI